MKFPALASLLAFACVASALAGDSAATAQAEADLKEHRIDEAIAILNQVIQANPQDARAYGDRAYAYTAMRDADRALLDCRAAIKLSPNFSQAYCIMGNANWIKGRMEDAENDFDEALTLDPHNMDLWYNRGLFHLHRDNARAVTDLSEAIRITPGYEQAWYNRGNARSDQEKYDLAIPDYTEAIRLKPADGNPYHQRGYAFQKTGQWDKAVQDFSKAIELKPGNDVEYFSRGYTYCELHAYDKAIQDYNMAIQLSPSNGGYYYQRALVYQKTGDASRSAADMKQAGQLNGLPKNP